jgi:hypothetical protein
MGAARQVGGKKNGIFKQGDEGEAEHEEVELARPPKQKKF